MLAQVKRIIPKKLIIFAKLSRLYIYDFKRFFLHSNVNQTFDTDLKLKGKLTIYYHVIEKGLTMPETRLGFGESTLLELISMLNMYMEKGYDTDALEFKHSVGTVKEYIDYHESKNYQLPSNIYKEATDIFSRISTNTPQTKQFLFNEKSYFTFSDSSFEKFALSRHSCRNYSNKPVPTELLAQCIALAQKSPTSCNRQVNRAYIIKDTNVKKQVLSLQYGNRGFGHLAETLIVLTADISVFQGVNDRNESYVNTGMFAMSLLYALHHYRIGACPLNWSVDAARDNGLRKVLSIPHNERIGLVISCGFLPENFMIASSPRLPHGLITKVF